MVVGNGLLARAFSKYNSNDDIVIFASGVSNSKTTDENQFEKEIILLLNAISKYPNAKFIYFSSLGVYDPSIKDTDYIKHKLLIESLIANSKRNYLIFRVSNAVGKSNNPFTILNYIVNAVKFDKEITIWSKAERNLIDIEDIVNVVDNCIDRENNSILNLAWKENIKVVDLLKSIELFYHKKAKVNYIEKGASFTIDTGASTKYLNALSSYNYSTNEYVQLLLNRYFN